MAAIFYLPLVRASDSFEINPFCSWRRKTHSIIASVRLSPLIDLFHRKLMDDLNSGLYGHRQASQTAGHITTPGFFDELENGVAISSVGVKPN